ncbi:fructuronate reductase [Tropicibacter naphthalenivorans]|uniref:Mannitol 2-dehydrogenase n=1 Tax=Tropicibacter naphthalenivorans TaxID=441103 RepID=A0A0P1GG84_9RHOB|nr:Mannitol 2-dehydrogenase [Tropicibacter naphthalenivorans]SMC90732.1 fructuronate reductase [Tropicibacter naphthalenivorans]
MTRLSLAHLGALPEQVAQPAYDPTAHGVGIVHLGLGAFHKAHQAAYTDSALAASGGDWRILGVSLRSPDPATQLTPQDGLFTLIERSAEGSAARVIGALAGAAHLGTDRAKVLAALTAPQTRIVSVTVTEKGYGIDRATGGVDLSHPAIAHDLAQPDQPIGVAGLLVWALRQRRAAGTPPFTVLCCDNLPENGAMLHGLLMDFTRRAAPDLLDHIRAEVACPSTMVDRITPASTPATLEAAQELLGLQDAAAIETERFTQWVIEDRFPNGRPDWGAAGAQFVDDVRPFEEMKLRMLNGAHSMLAYAGFLAGHKHVSDVMADPGLARLVRRHLRASAATLPPLPGWIWTPTRRLWSRASKTRTCTTRPIRSPWMAPKNCRNASLPPPAPRWNRGNRWTPLPLPWPPGCATCWAVMQQASPMICAIRARTRCTPPAGTGPRRCAMLCTRCRGCFRALCWPRQSGDGRSAIGCN